MLYFEPVLIMEEIAGFFYRVTVFRCYNPALTLAVVRVCYLRRCQAGPRPSGPLPRPGPVALLALVPRLPVRGGRFRLVGAEEPPGVGVRGGPARGDGEQKSPGAGPGAGGGSRWRWTPLPSAQARPRSAPPRLFP